MFKSKQTEKILFKAIASLTNTDEVQAFLADLCTPAEIQAMSERLIIAKLLFQGDHSYREISEKTGASTTTVGRVARFLKDENYGGYTLVIQRMEK